MRSAITPMSEYVLLTEKASKQIFYHTNQGRLLAIKVMNRLNREGPRKYKDMQNDLAAAVKFLETSLGHWEEFEPPLD